MLALLGAVDTRARVTGGLLAGVPGAGDVMGDRYGDNVIDLAGAPGYSPPVVTMSDVTPERVTWLWLDRLPAGKLVILDGDPATGKSTLALDLAARVSTGSPWPDRAPGGAPADVLILSAEDGLADTIAPRLITAGADLDRVHALTEVEVLLEDEIRLVPPSLPRDIAHLERVVTEKQVRLVVVDVLMAYLSGRVDAHRDQDVRGVLHQLAAMADRTSATVMLIRHLRKSHGGPALYAGGGSIGIIGAARAAYLVGRDPDDKHRRILATAKSNLGPEAPSLAYRLIGDELYDAARVAWEADPTTHTAADLLRVPADDAERTERGEAGEWLHDYLTGLGGCAGAGETIKAAARDGISKTTLHLARKAAGITSSKAGMGAGWVWTLPGTAAEDSASTPEESEDSSAQELESSEPSEVSNGHRTAPADLLASPRRCALCSTPFVPEHPSRAACERCRAHIVGHPRPEGVST
jgi:AAA domain